MNLKTVTQVIEVVLENRVFDENEITNLELIARRYVELDTVKSGAFAKTQLAFKDKEGGAFVIDIKHFRDEATFPPAYDDIPEAA